MLRAFSSIPIVVAVLAASAPASAEPCDDATLQRILAPRREGDDTAVVDCDLALTPLLSTAITKNLAYVGSASSGAVLDCGGGSLGREGAPLRIVITSDRVGSSAIEGIGVWDPPSDITIRNCEIHGSVRIRGMGVGRRDDEVTRSSHHPLGHVARVRAAAPRRVTIEDSTLVADGATPLFVSPGVEDTTIVRSYLTGRARSVAIYLDAESRGTTVRHCMIDTETPRELIGIDGSEENRIIGNWLSNLDKGGIYLYRNCGERSFVRMTPAQHNEILGNVFYYRRYTGPNPAVFLGSDDGFSTHRFCHDDLDHPYGSGVDDRDSTSRNAVMDNQIIGRDPGEVLHTEWPESNGPNYLEQNVRVVRGVSRPAGCFTRADHDPRFLPHGASTVLRTDRDGRPYTHPVEVTCNDGDLAYASTVELAPAREVPFGCAVSGDNEGCSGEVRCAEGETLVGARAACNLEFGPVSDQELASVPRDAVWIVRWSDDALEGRCWVGEHRAAAGEIPLAGRLGDVAAPFGCREHDRNGGDCEIRGIALCAPRAR